jgi:dynein heavy chain, axonemal
MCPASGAGAVGTCQGAGVSGASAAGDYLKMGVPREERMYEEVVDQKRLLVVLAAQQEEHNLAHRSPASLVFFQDTVQHISRICRILRQPR